MTQEKENGSPSIKERLATIEEAIKDIKDNHLKVLCNEIKRVANRLWWLIGIMVLFLLGMVSTLLGIIFRIR